MPQEIKNDHDTPRLDAYMIVLVGMKAAGATAAEDTDRADILNHIHGLLYKGTDPKEIATLIREKGLSWEELIGEFSQEVPSIYGGAGTGGAIDKAFDEYEEIKYDYDISALPKWYGGWFNTHVTENKKTGSLCLLRSRVKDLIVGDYLQKQATYTRIKEEVTGIPGDPPGTGTLLLDDAIEIIGAVHLEGSLQLIPDEVKTHLPNAHWRLAERIARSGYPVNTREIFAHYRHGNLLENAVLASELTPRELELIRHSYFIEEGGVYIDSDGIMALFPDRYSDIQKVNGLLKSAIMKVGKTISEYKPALGQPGGNNQSLRLDFPLKLIQDALPYVYTEWVEQNLTGPARKLKKVDVDALLAIDGSKVAPILKSADNSVSYKAPYYSERNVLAGLLYYHARGWLGDRLKQYEK